MTMDKLNVGLIGGGFMGKAHSLAYAAMPMFFWPAPAIPVRRTLAEVTDERAQDIAAQYGFEQSTSNWRDLIEDPDIHIIDIATPNNMHAEAAIAAAEAAAHHLRKAAVEHIRRCSSHVRSGRSWHREHGGFQLSPHPCGRTGQEVHRGRLHR